MASKPKVITKAADLRLIGKAVTAAEELGLLGIADGISLASIEKAGLLSTAEKVIYDRGSPGTISTLGFLLAAAGAGAVSPSTRRPPKWSFRWCSRPRAPSGSASPSPRAPCSASSRTERNRRRGAGERARSHLTLANAAYQHRTSRGIHSPAVSPRDGLSLAARPPIADGGAGDRPALVVVVSGDGHVRLAPARRARNLTRVVGAVGSLDLNAQKCRCGSGENPTPPLSHTTSPSATLSPTFTLTLPALMCTYSTNRSPPLVSSDPPGSKLQVPASARSPRRPRAVALRVELDHDAVPLEQVTDRHAGEGIILAHLHHRPGAHRQQLGALVAPKINRVEVAAEEVRQAPALALRAQPRTGLTLAHAQGKPNHQGVLVVGRRVPAPVLHVAVNLRRGVRQRRRVHNRLWRNQEDERDALPASRRRCPSCDPRGTGSRHDPTPRYRTRSRSTARRRGTGHDTSEEGGGVPAGKLLKGATRRLGRDNEATG